MKIYLKLFSLTILSCLLSATIFAAAGTVKIFSEVQGVELYVDEKHVGTNKAEINNIEAGSHYIKAIQNGVVIFSELVSTPAGITTTVLVKGTNIPKTTEISAKYKEQQEYKRKKLDILLSKNFQTSGASYTYGDSFPGYYSIFNSSWTKSASTTYEVTDWKIVQGGLQQIPDLQFARMVNDLNTIAYYEQRVKEIEDGYGLGGILTLGGIVAVVGGFSSALSTPANVDSGAIIATLGILSTLIGFSMLTATPPEGHFVAPSTAALQAYEFNQALKTQLGLPENYEP